MDSGPEKLAFTARQFFYKVFKMKIKDDMYSLKHISDWKISNCLIL